jgi:hypothetical protein
MTGRRVVLESIVLPGLFITVAAAGGFRVSPAGELSFLPPSLFHCVLGALVLGALVQSRVLRPGDLLGRSSLLEVASGAALMAALFAASAQLLNGLVPESGPLALLFNLFFAVLLSNTIAAAPNASRLLRSLGVTFAWALLMKYVLLAGVAAPDAGWAARVLRLVVRGAAWGELGVPGVSPLVGYVMFGAAALFLLGLWLLAGDKEPASAL